MKTIVSIALIVLFSFARCQDDANGGGLKFADVLESVGKFSIAMMVLEATGTTSIVANTPNITIFLPTDYAFRTVGRELGCGNLTSVNATISCVMSLYTQQEMARLISYHIVLQAMPSDIVLKTKLFTTALRGLPLFRKRLSFVDQVPQMKNARLVPDKIDIAYENGIIHAINRVFMPFTTMIPADPCEMFEFPLSVRNGSFIPVYSLSRAVLKCPAVRQATLDCVVDDSNICNTGRAKFSLGSGITVGKAVAAAKLCGSIRRALADSCGFDPLNWIPLRWTRFQIPS